MNLDKLPIEFGNYEIKSKIGKGVNGVVYKAIDKTNFKEVAIKIFYFKKSYENRQDILELVSPNALKTSGIVKMFGFRFPLTKEQKQEISLPKISNKSKSHKIDLKNPLIITEYMKNGSIKTSTKEYIESKGVKNDKMNPTIRSKIIFGVASIMKRAHSHKITHRDLKLENIFLDEKLEPKIGDFGMAKLIENKVKFMNPQTLIKQPLVIENELFTNEGEKFEEDVYSYAFILYKLFSKKIVFDEKKQPKTPDQFMMKIVSRERPVKPDGMPDCYWELVQSCWNSDPKKRPSFNDIVELLKNDSFVLNEFGINTNLDELHEYQNRIESEEIEIDLPKIFDPKTTFTFEKSLKK